MNRREVRFQITEERNDGKYRLCVHPTLTNIYRDEGGERILLAIACNCIRAVGKTDGLERAMERCADLVVTHTRVIRDDAPRDKWPWES